MVDLIMNRTKLISLLLIGVALLVSCDKELKPADVIIIDPVRHYYPVIQGETLGVSYDIENISDNPLFIQEIQTTCGCLIPRDEMPITILPHKRGTIHIDYNSIKNTGYVEHFIYCYGNFKDTTWVELRFDTNIVPQADFIRDYEQLWHEQTNKSGSMRDYVDGLTSQKGYYTSESELTPRDEQRQKVQEELDDIAF